MLQQVPFPDNVKDVQEQPLLMELFPELQLERGEGGVDVLLVGTLVGEHQVLLVYA